MDVEVNLPRPRWFRHERCLSRFRVLSLALGLAAVGADARADLLTRSPFLPDDFDPRTPGEQRQENKAADPLAQRVEFRGFYRINGEYRFLIKEKDKPAGRWVRMDDPAAEFLVREFDPEARSVRLRFGEQEGLIELVRLDSNPTPMAVSGQPPADPARDKIRADAVASNNNGAEARPANASSASNSRGTVRRRTPPPPPQWLQDRLAARGVDTAATMEAISQGPPNFIPPPPPDFVPPPPPDRGDGGSSGGGRGNPPSQVPTTPPGGLPPGGPPAAPPDIQPPPPPGR